MANKPPTKKVVNEYINLEWPDFESKNSGKDLDLLLTQLTSAEFDEAHISIRHSAAMNETQDKTKIAGVIKEDLIQRGFNEEYITAYLQEVNKLKPEDIVLRGIKNDILPHFKYRENRLTLSDLRGELSLQDITTTGLDSKNKEAIEAQIKLYINQVPAYEKGLMVLLDELDELKTEQEYTPLSRAVSSVTRISPSNKADREEIYVFYEERFKMFAELKNVIDEVLTLWDGVEEILDDVEDEEGNSSKKRTGKYISTENSQGSEDEVIEELDNELKRLHKIHDKMSDDMNYVLKTGLMPYSVITNRDRSISANIEAGLISTLSKLLGKKAVEILDDDVEEDFYEIDEGTYQGNVGDKAPEGKPQPMAETEFRGKTEGDEELDTLLDELDKVEIIQNVDPLFIIASEEGVIKSKYSISSWNKTKDELTARLKDAGKSNPGAVSIYRAALAEHEAFQEQAFDEEDSRDTFYLPISETCVRALTKVNRNFKVDLDKVIDFHMELIEVILDLLEDPLEKSTIPIHVSMSDMAPGKESAGKERLPTNEQQRNRMKEQFNLFERLKVGKKGKKREEVTFGKFTESLVELFSIADKYYGDPIRELMIPYKSTPKYLDMDTLSPLINHGPENVGQLTLSLYRDYYHSSITPRDLTRLTDYLVSDNQARKRPSDMEKRANGVLDVLEKLAPNNQDNDIHWFANEFTKHAARDSSYDISGITLQNRKIESLVFDRSQHKTSYHPLLWMIYKFKEQFEKNAYITKQYQRFEKAYKSQSDMKLASVAQTKILEAHDEIRKMIGKPIYYNTCQLDSFTHINDTIDLMKEEYKVELTGSDISGIVHEFDSMETIAKRYGVNTNVVYHVKAMYR